MIGIATPRKLESRGNDISETNMDPRFRRGHASTHFANLLRTDSGIACDLSLPPASRTTQTRFSEHST